MLTGYGNVSRKANRYLNHKKVSQTSNTGTPDQKLTKNINFYCLFEFNLLFVYQIIHSHPTCKAVS